MRVTACTGIDFCVGGAPQNVTAYRSLVAGFTSAVMTAYVQVTTCQSHHDNVLPPSNTITTERWKALKPISIMKSTKQAKTTLDGAITPAVFAFCWLFNNMYEKRTQAVYFTSRVT